MLVSLFPLGCLALSQTKDSAREEADFVLCGRVLSTTTTTAKAKSPDTVLMLASIELLHQHKGRTLKAKTVGLYYEVSAGTVFCGCPPEVKLGVGQTYVFAACTNVLKAWPDELYLHTGDFVDATNACCATTIQRRPGLENRESVAAAICSGSSCLERGQVKLAELLPLLHDQRVIFVDDDGTAVTVRDMAFTMLEDAAIVKLPFKQISNKLICGCEIKGEWNRVHVLTLTDENFGVVITAIQQSLR